MKTWGSFASLVKSFTGMEQRPGGAWGGGDELQYIDKSA